MHKPKIIVISAIFLCLLIAVSQTIMAAPSYTDYDNLQDLYELIMEKELLPNTYDQPQHKIMRKNSRSPSLRLRFGRRSDPSIYQGNRHEDHQYQSSPE